MKVTQAAAGNYLNGGSANNYVRQSVWGADLDVSAGTSIPLFMQIGLIYLSNTRLIGVTNSAATCMGGYGVTRTQCAKALGVLMDPTTNVSIKPFSAIGCKFTRTVMIEHNYSTVPNWDSMDGMVVANNHFLNMQVALVLARDNAVARGLAVVQNVMERLLS